MSFKVLFIDDDYSLLTAIERSLAADFEITIATGVKDAMNRIESQGAFPVVVVDMVMPSSDGIATIQAVRERLPEAIFMVLTGSKDIEVAKRALNHGRVFRFLTKPCETSELRNAIVEAHSHFVEVAREKELLLETMMGSLNMLTDFAELSSDRLVDPNQMKDRFLDIAETMHVAVNSQDIAACSVMAVGLASMNVYERTRLKETAIYDLEHRVLLNKLCQASSRIVSRIPQFSPICALLSKISNADTLSPATDPRGTAATLIRIMFYWSLMDNSGFDREGIAQCLKKAMPTISDKHWTCILHELACTTQKIPKMVFVSSGI